MKENKYEAQNICPHMNGAKCATKFCDYWNRHKQECSLAIECKLNVELLARRVRRNRRRAAEEKRDKEVRDHMAKKNIVPVNRTMQ